MRNKSEVDQAPNRRKRSRRVDNNKLGSCSNDKKTRENNVGNLNKNGMSTDSMLKNDCSNENLTSRLLNIKSFNEVEWLNISVT